ncbi:unnamed protein product [Amaranthus hypochondriacus]
MGGSAVARGCGRPRKERRKVEQSPQTWSAPSTPCDTPSNTPLDDGILNPKLHKIDLEVLNSAMELNPVRISWASVVQGTPLITQQRMEEVQPVPEQPLYEQLIPIDNESVVQHNSAHKP